MNQNKNIDRIINALRKAGIDFDEEDFAPEKPFRDSRIDSLDVMSLFLTLEEEHGIKFSPEEASSITTPNELADALCVKIANTPR